MQAVWNGQIIAEADKSELIYIEGNWYFPRSALRVTIQSDGNEENSSAAATTAHLRPSPTEYTCPWKGECQYYDICAGEICSHDTAWSYPSPKSSAIDIVKKDFSNYVAFWRDVEVKE